MIKERRRTSCAALDRMLSDPRTPHPHTDGWRGCFIGIWSAGRGRSSRGAGAAALFTLQIAVPGAASLHTARRPPSCAEVRAQRFCVPLTELRCRAAVRTGNAGLRCGCEPSAHSPLQASEMRLSTKEEVRPHHLDSI